jgi:hypothetical protein
MKYVCLDFETGYTTVREIVPESATILPGSSIPSIEGIAHFYGADFASHCKEAPDEAEQGWSYDPEGNTFSPPPEEPGPEPVFQQISPMAELEAMAVDHEYRLTMLELGV